MSVNVPGAVLPSQAEGRDPVAQRIMTVLEACAAPKQPLTITQLVDATGLAKTTVHRMCWRLVELGLLEHAEVGFSIGTKLLALANANPMVTKIRAAAIPYLVELQKLTGASDLAILTGGKALVVDGLFTKNLGGVPLVGVGLPLHCCAVGKAILARLDRAQREQLLGPGILPAATSRSIVHPVMIRRHLDRVAETGIAISNEELQLGMIGVAAAFKVREGTMAAIGCVSASTNRMIIRSARRVAEAAAQLERSFEERSAVGSFGLI